MTGAHTHNAAPPATGEAATTSLLMRMMTLSVAAAIATIVLKLIAAIVTDSVGFLSDAMESLVNLAAALVGLWAVRLSSRPPDLGHHFGHGNAEYLSAAVEGALVFVAAGAIVWSAVGRLFDPQPLEQAGIGLALSIAASLLNGGVGLALIRVGRRHRSMTLVADGKHLLTDVVTSVGVIVGIVLVTVFKWPILDPIVALLVGANILWTGVGLLRRSVTGLLGAAIEPEDAAQIEALLDRFRSEEPVDFHAVRTRESGRRRFVYLHLLVPDEWSVKRAHDLADRVQDGIAAVLPDTHTFIHIEPIDDASSYDHPTLPEGMDSSPPVPLPDDREAADSDR